MIHTPKKLSDLKCGDMVRLYPHLTYEHFERDYLIAIWSNERYTSDNHEYHPLMAVCMDGEYTDSIGVHDDTKIGPITKEDYEELSRLLLERGLIFNKKRRQLLTSKEYEKKSTAHR